MAVEERLQAARRLYDGFAAGDRQALLAELAPEFHGVVADGMPADLAGDYYGPAAMLRDCWGKVLMLFDVRPVPDEYLQVGDGRIVVLGRYEGTARKSGRALSAAFAHVLRISDDGIVELRQITDTACWHAALEPPTEVDGRSEATRPTARTETPRTHSYRAVVRWGGDRGGDTFSGQGYDRAHEILAEGKPPVLGSADPAFRGDPARWNPEELLVAALSQCHMLWYLHLAADAHIVVVDYVDEASGTMSEHADGAGEFTSVMLRPTVTIVEASALPTASALHQAAATKCFIARSVNFPVHHAATMRVTGGTG